MMLRRVRLRWLVCSLTLAGVTAFVALAILHPRSAPIALAGALLVALKGIGWLLLLRHYRARLRTHGYRW
ncbi:MAG: hypothetical protein ACYDCQ_04310 [Dehalococcoidia bacterium]